LVLFVSKMTCTDIFLQQALEHTWLSGKTASDHDLLPDIRTYVARARLRRGIELVKLANRIEALKIQDDDEAEGDVPKDAAEAASEALVAKKFDKGLGAAANPLSSTGKKSLSKIARGAIFREVVLAKVREMKDEEARKQFEREATERSSK
jgi:calcium/calmodulin-dependent protein kinase I